MVLGRAISGNENGSRNVDNVVELSLSYSYSKLLSGGDISDGFTAPTLEVIHESQVEEFLTTPCQS